MHQYRYLGTPESRAAQRARFSAFFTELCQAHPGGVPAVCLELGVSRAATSDWLAGRHTPRLETLARIAEVFELPLNTVLDAAGKPPLEHLRERHATNPDATLAGIIRRHRATVGLENRQMASLLGISVFEAARYAAGSAVPAKLSIYARFAKALGYTVLELMDAAGLPATAEARRAYPRNLEGLAGTVRYALEAAGFDSWDETSLRRAAKTVNMPVARLHSLVTGSSDATLLECQRLAALGTADLDALLTATGWDAADVTTFVAALAAARARRRPKGRPSYDTVGELLRSYRVAAELSQYEVGRALGVAHTTVLRLETGERSCDPRQLARLAAVIGAPLERLLLAAGHVA